jgi:hypothetical protein
MEDKGAGNGTTALERQVLDGRGGARDRRYPDLPWEPNAAFDTLAKLYDP